MKQFLPVVIALGLMATPALAAHDPVPVPPHFPHRRPVEPVAAPSMQDQINAMTVAVNQIVMRLAGQIAADQQTLAADKQQIESLTAQLAKQAPTDNRPSTVVPRLHP